MSAFPTFRLPFLAAKAVVNQMDLSDLTSLFLCSKKTKKFIKILRKTVSFVSLSLEQKKSLNFLEIIELFREEKVAGWSLKDFGMKVDIKISDDIGFKIGVELGIQEYLSFYVYAKRIDQQDRYKGTRRILKIGDMEIPVVMKKKDVIYTFWNSKQEGFEKIGEYLKENIASTVSSLLINVGKKKDKDHRQNLRFVTNWMNSTNRVPESCKIYNTNGNTINENGVKFILDNVHPLKELNIRSRLGEKFQHITNIKSDYLYLPYANWFTLENLLTADCEKIRLGRSKLTNNDLNEYLKKWTAGKFPKLRKLDVEMQENMNIDIILSGMELYGYAIATIERNHKYLAKISTPGRTLKTFEMEIFLNRQLDLIFDDEIDDPMPF